MKLSVNELAVKWYIEELNLKQGDFVRFFVRYGGTGIVSGFSLGVSIEQPVDAGIETQSHGITFYIEEKDLWYFEDHDLNVQFNEKFSEPVFDYVKR